MKGIAAKNHSYIRGCQKWTKSSQLKRECSAQTCEIRSGRRLCQSGRRELHRREVALKRESGKILLEAAKVKDYDGYRERLAEFLEQSNELGASALAQYVMHRKIVIELFDKALSADRKTEKYPLEEAVHNILFPMRSTDRDTLYSQHNLWMIDERLTYHWFLSSDKPLKKLDEFQSTSSLRPDLFIFDRKITFSAGEEGQQPVNSGG